MVSAPYPAAVASALVISVFIMMRRVFGDIQGMQSGLCPRGAVNHRLPIGFALPGRG